MSFPMHKEYPSTQRLDIHLENDSRVYFNENESSDQVLSRTLPETTLTAWFKYNLENPEDNEAKQTLYPDFCEKVLVEPLAESTLYLQKILKSII
ncbi:uncharacterized protein ATC70_001464 [Mucor velutinosus]|uniref:Uncharacterized protein n=1 Tax=Mucor velutinosus TaxID=708070 RepID=A0AAN7DJW8_9FUNG|nr:hypothetical protein ATC70_001464 [Mucor velutinosus]